MSKQWEFENNIDLLVICILGALKAQFTVAISQIMYSKGEIPPKKLQVTKKATHNVHLNSWDWLM